MKRTHIFAVVIALITSLAGYSYAGSRAKAAATAVSPDRGAGVTVTGRVHFDGHPPKLARTASSTDPSCPRSASATNEEFITSPNGSLANVVVYISAGLGEQTFDVPSEAAVIQQK